MRLGAIVAMVVSCASGCKSQPAGVAPTEAASTETQMTTSRIRIRPVAAGYGGVGPASLAPQPDLWTVVFVEIESSAKLHRVEIAAVDLLDAGGDVASDIPRGLRPSDDVAETARRDLDYGEHGTVPFDGETEPGRPLRLRIHAPLDTRAASLRPAPVRVRVRIRAASDPGAAAEAPLQGPWPTG